MRITSECVSNFENCNSGWFAFIPAKYDGGFRWEPSSPLKEAQQPPIFGPLCSGTVAHLSNCWALVLVVLRCGLGGVVSPHFSFVMVWVRLGQSVFTSRIIYCRKLLTCINNGFIDHFHHDSHLRIHTIRLLWMETKEVSIKFRQILDLAESLWRTIHTWTTKYRPTSCIHSSR